MATAEDRNLTLLVVAVSLAFAWILWPFYAAILWGVVMAILFAPLYRQLAALRRRRRTVAALATLVIIVVMVILPLALVTALLVQEATGVYDRIRSGELDLGRYFRQVVAALPAWATSLLDLRVDAPGRGAGAAVRGAPAGESVPRRPGPETSCAPSWSARTRRCRTSCWSPRSAAWRSSASTASSSGP